MPTATRVVSAIGSLFLLATLSAAQTSPTRWVSPFFTDMSPYLYTYVAVLNVGTASETVTVTFYDRNGTVLHAEPHALPPGAAWYFSTWWIPAVRNRSGSIAVTSSSSGTVQNLRLWSTVIGGLQSSSSMSSLAGSWDPEPSGGSWVAPFFMAYGTSIYTLVRVMNTGLSTQTVTIEFHDSLGTLVSERHTSLAPGATWDLATSEDPRAASVGTGWIRVRASSSGNSRDLAPWSATVIWGVSGWITPGSWHAR